MNRAFQFGFGRSASASLFAALLGCCLGGARLALAELPKTADRAAAQAVEGASGTPIIVARAEPACFSAAVRATGLFAPRAEAVVGMTRDGFAVVEIFAGEGDVVSEGQPLARLARISAEPGAGRPGAVAPASIVLRAPAAGAVVASTARVGAAASPQGAPLFRLAVDGLIEVDLEVSSIDLAAVKEGQAAQIETEPGREMAGQVRKLSAEIDPVTQMGHVRVEIPRDAALRVGRFVRARIDARRSCGISVPRSAVLYKADGTSVQVVRHSQIETLPVTVGLTTAEDAEIQEGLRAGELVVAHAGASLRDGDRVSPVLAGSQGQPAGRP